MREAGVLVVMRQEIKHDLLADLQRRRIHLVEILGVLEWILVLCHAQVR